ncbi:3-dehydroquinate synthase [wastewater metagenome]|uniref:3-dehydroquinate synthase n=2 Tax=unclassified sequences TaxID=12908 RepID=A0A5B8R8H6_9ZZZZ|nr:MULTISPECIES: 3-dehydroquinate synthase [Arhodomonas]MCS4505284.1 3-dehydroquinate synthase [Arhodomonas aquaeolei]QEA05026.1 3-dehydroquinate synthase [uncultured organism]
MTATPRTVHVDLAERGYPITIGHGLLGGEAFTRQLRGDQVLIVTNETVAPLYLQAVRTALYDRHVETLVLPDGEAYKTLATLERVYDALVAARFDRSATLLALGGGVIGDLTGFAAATYQRGVDFIQVPTTLLAMVDSSVGGKTAVNHPEGKNMIGAFHQPRLVLADTATLESLPEREFRAGLAEVIKYGVIQDYAFFQWLQRHLDEVLARDPEALAHVIEQSCRDKARVVAADERETGQRALLNLGHTFGHAIETVTGYTDWLHGEAVAAGICMAAWMSVREGRMARTAFQRIHDLIAAAGLPTRPPAVDAGRFRGCMEIDKKARGGRLRLVLLEGIGNAMVTGGFDDAALEATLAEYLEAPGAE